MINSDHKVLIIDDEYYYRIMLKSLLEKQLKINVLMAGSFAKALKILNNTIPDLIILDVHMPGMDGYMALRTMRDNERTVDIPVIAFSAYSSERLVRQFIEMDIEDFIVKTSDNDVIVDKISKALTKTYKIL